MNNITGLFQNPDKKGYTDVYVDGEFLLTISDDAVIEAGLGTGKQLDEQGVLEIERAVTFTKAKNKAYTYLSYGDMSAKKLYDKLVHAGFDPDIATDCVESMKSLGYIDDSRYAKVCADTLAKVKLYGPRRIREELFVRGVSNDDIDVALDELEVDFEQNIKTLISGKFKSKTDKHKLVAALIRYGYDYDMIGYIDYE